MAPVSERDGDGWIEDDPDDGEWGEDGGGDFAPGPDERDRDLLDGSWEERYYAGRAHRRDWSAVGVGITLLVLLALVLPILLVALR